MKKVMEHGMEAGSVQRFMKIMSCRSVAKNSNIEVLDSLHCHDAGYPK